MGMSSFIGGVSEIQLQQTLRLGFFAEMKDALVDAVEYERHRNK